jgi:cytochrome c-type biogenesis protein CcmE
MPSLKILLIVFLVLGSLGFLIYSALQDNSQQYVTITELNHGSGIAPGAVLKLKGKIVDGTVAYDPQVPKLTFDLADGPQASAVHVQSSELKPDNFKPGNECIVEGTYDRASARFVASKVMTKCPSKYEGQQEEQETKTTQP